MIKSSFIQRKLFSFSKSSALGLVTRVLNPISQICWEGSSSSRLTVEFGEGEDVQQRWWRFTNEELQLFISTGMKVSGIFLKLISDLKTVQQKSGQQMMSA